MEECEWTIKDVMKGTESSVTVDCDQDASSADAASFHVQVNVICSEESDDAGIL